MLKQNDSDHKIESNCKKIKIAITNRILATKENHTEVVTLV